MGICIKVNKKIFFCIKKLCTFIFLYLYLYKKIFVCIIYVYKDVFQENKKKENKIERR